jgi:hypothetical protein
MTANLSQHWKWGAAALALAAAIPAALVLLPGQPAPAADHLDPPTRTDGEMGATSPDVPADIADVFAWHTADSIIVGLTFAGPREANAAGIYDRDVLYTINISTAAPAATPEFQIRVRFGEDTTKTGTQPGVQFSGIPGVTGNIEGPVETTFNRDGVVARAGLFQDPFFFDLIGFRETRSMNTLRFNNQRDFFLNKNDTGFIIEIPRSRLSTGSNPIDVWATAARFGARL